MHVGSVLPMSFFTNAQLQSSNGDRRKLAPHLSIDLKLVGIVVFNTQIAEDDIDALGDNPVLLTPALMRELVPCSAAYTFEYIKVSGGSRNVGKVRAEIAAADPKLSTGPLSGGGPPTSDAVAKAERAIKPESLALGVFGAIAALAALLIAAQLIGRQLRLGPEERASLRALGASPATTISDRLLGVLAAVVLGALLADVVAVGLSPLAPLGPVRSVQPSSITFDWTVIGTGFAALVVLLGGGNRNRLRPGTASHGRATPTGPRPRIASRRARPRTQASRPPR